jgi:hypothetical protein
MHRTLHHATAASAGKTVDCKCGPITTGLLGLWVLVVIGPQGRTLGSGLATMQSNPI